MQELSRGFHHFPNGKHAERAAMKSMRRLIFLPVICVMLSCAHAACPKRACYIVTFQVASCEVRARQVIPPALTENPGGLLLVPKTTEAHPVACDRSKAVVTSTPDEDLKIVSERAFLYPTSEGCDRFAGKKVSLFASNVCCDAQHSYACGVPGRLLEPLEIPKDIGCPETPSSKGCR